MKMQSNNFLEKLVKDEIAGLTTQVKETLALEFKKTGERIFSAAELWNIQRQRRAFIQRRASF